MKILPLVTLMMGTAFAVDDINTRPDKPDLTILQEMYREIGAIREEFRGVRQDYNPLLGKVKDFRHTYGFYVNPLYEKAHATCQFLELEIKFHHLFGVDAIFTAAEEGARDPGKLDDFLKQVNSYHITYKNEIKKDPELANKFRSFKNTLDNIKLQAESARQRREEEERLRQEQERQNQPAQQNNIIRDFIEFKEPTTPDEARETLGLEMGATREEIARAHRRISRNYHHDLNPNNPVAEVNIRIINNARDLLNQEIDQQEMIMSSFRNNNQ